MACLMDAARRGESPVMRIYTIDLGEQGAGRIWRTDQPGELIMNTAAMDDMCGSDCVGKVAKNTFSSLAAGFPSVERVLPASGCPLYAEIVISSNTFVERRAIDLMRVTCCSCS